MKLTVKLHTLGLSTTLPHKQVQESFYWQSRLLQSHVKQWSPSGLCTQPPPPLFNAARPWLQSQTRREFCCEIWRRHCHHRSGVRQQWEINNLAEWCTQKKLQLSVGETKELVVYFLKRKKKRGKHINPAEEEQMNRFLVNGKFKSQRFCHGRHPLPLSKKENRAALFLKEKLKKIKICCQGLVNLFRRATQSVLTEAPAWCVHGRGRESNSMQLKLPRTSFVSINSASVIFFFISEVPVQNKICHQRQHPPQPQSVTEISNAVPDYGLWWLS